MAVSLRLKRLGRKGYPMYRLVAADQRRSRDGKFIEELGSYNPHQSEDGEKTNIKKERVEYWLKQGGQPTQTVKVLLKKARNRSVIDKDFNFDPCFPQMFSVF